MSRTYRNEDGDWFAYTPALGAVGPLASEEIAERVRREIEDASPEDLTCEDCRGAYYVDRSGTWRCFCPVADLIEERRHDI